MKREEAIHTLNLLFVPCASDGNKWGCKRNEAIDMAIEALKAEPIRCKDCKHRQTDECLMYYEEWYEIDEGDGYGDTDFIIHDYTRDDGFCHHGERREP